MPSVSATEAFKAPVDHREFLTTHGEMIAQPLRDQFPHVDLKVRRDCATLLAGTHRWPGGAVIKTIPGGDEYTGVALRIYPPDPTDADALAGFVRIDELNVAKRARRQVDLDRDLPGADSRLSQLRHVAGLVAAHAFDARETV